ncbi:MAG: single-stranded DNA-binding protein [Phycisphaerae bacterium]|nr:single-stranded DNA-binding protein [Phycisphaerae bacterium]
MANYNRVILMGNLTRDPQLTYTPSNTPVAEFGLAVNRKWRTPDGQDREETCFVDCSLYGRSAETFNQYMSKGKPVLVEGRLKLNQWETPEGQKRSKLSVVAERFQFVGGRSGGGDYGGGQQQPPRPQRQAAPAQQANQAPPSYDDEVPPPSDDDIPF